MRSAPRGGPPGTRRGAVDEGPPGLSSGAWILAHTAQTHDSCINHHIGGHEHEEALRGFNGDEPGAPAFDLVQAAVERVMARSAEVLGAFQDSRLTQAFEVPSSSWLAGWTVGQLLVRSVAHLYVHSAELNLLVTLGGGEDLYLPRAMTHTASAP